MNIGYHASANDFIIEDVDRIVGLLAQSVADTGMSSQYSRQISVWKEQVNLLKHCLQQLSDKSVGNFETWHIALEYEFPRRYKRPDAILLAKDRILVIEFKFGTDQYEAAAKWQVDDYALNLRDFHAGSHGRYIVPILCAVDAPSITSDTSLANQAIIAPTQFANGKNLSSVIHRICGNSLPHTAIAHPLTPVDWLASPYRPTLTIIEAAEQLYSNHSVREISHNYAENLDKTTEMLANVISDAKQFKKRIICFVTGVPGAGKTLTGLNVVHDPVVRSKQGPSGIFLSGNGPLVKIVREALILNRQQSGRRRKDAEHEVSTFIQNVHQFLRYHRNIPTIVPHENVVVFDEAQRAWNQEQMFRKQGVDRSEAAELLEVMERPADWAVIVALVGGGQEIFIGEAGLEEWGNAIKNAQNRWVVVASPEVVKGGESVAGHRLFKDMVPDDIEIRPEVLAHLSVSVRSHRAQSINQWVNNVLDLDAVSAKMNFPNAREFPFVVTRDLESARSWLKARSGNDPAKRCGLVVTSEDQRFRAHGLENSTNFRMGYSFEKWFLAPPEDVRSSFMLEVSASEFECQGLELDWVGLCWGGDLTPSGNGRGWEYRKFRGTVWQNCRSEIEQAYIRNRYRVLLTRARAGMVIWIPPGSSTDLTRDSDRFDLVYDLLKSAGVPDLATMEVVQ
ncbi:MAG: DUF2075 domain-containing protein [Nitrospira sp.]|nr:DUF2075 domain-containing protein [Nitrospira sp.]